MSNKRYYWLKLKEDYLNSPKIKKLRKIAGGDTYTIIYLKMQLLSIPNKGTITFEEIENTFEEELALKLDEQLENVQITLAYLTAQNLIEINGKDCLFVEASNSIGSECDSAERVRLFRKRQNEEALPSNEYVTSLKRDSISISNSISESISISNSNNINNTNNKESNKKNNNIFRKPSVEEIQEYCEERGNSVDAQYFYDYYERNGWVVGKTKMKDWKAAVRTWERNARQRAQTTQPATTSLKRTYQIDEDGVMHI